MITRLKSTDFTSATISAITGPTITSVQIASDNTYATILDDTAVGTSGGYIIINGTGFVSGCQVYIDSTISTSVTFVNSTRVNVQVPASSSGTYVIYLINPDGSMAIRINGITYSVFPAWSTGSNLPDLAPAVLLALSATSDSNITYSLAEGSSLPPGLTLSSGGTISGTWTGSGSTTYNFTVVATDTELQSTSRTFSVTIVINDSYFPNTTLLLGGLSSANTWIQDSSTNKFVLTVNGQTSPSSSNPHKTNYSNYFDGTGDYLSLANNVALNPETSDFVMEAWVYITGTTGNNQGFNGKGTAGTDGYSFFITNALVLSFIWNGTGGGTITAGTLTLNTWNHVAVVRSSNVIRLYLNGVGGASTACTTDITSTATKFVGQARGGNPILGYINNYRMIKGSLPSGYDATSSTLSLPTASFTAVTNTRLLTCQSNRFIDTSSNNFTITVAGNVTVSNFIPFVETDTLTGSGYFDGTGDHLSLTSSVLDTGAGTADVTFECWVYNNGFSGTQYGRGIFAFYPAASYNANRLILRLGTGANHLNVYFLVNSTVQFGTSGTNSIGLATPYAWTHVALVRSSQTFRLYINGVLDAATFSATTESLNTFDTFNIGRCQDGTVPDFNGNISDFRYVKGTAVYTSAFTPPIGSLTAVGNTQLLTLQYRLGENNSRFIDESGQNNVISKQGNITQGTFSPFSQTGWSNYFDGSSTLATPAGLNSALGGGFAGNVYTMEAWVFPTAYSAGTSYYTAITGTYAAVAANGRWFFGYRGSAGTTANVVFAYTTGTGSQVEVTSATAPVILNQWSHIAVTIDSTTAANTTVNLFCNGVPVANSTGNNFTTQTAFYGNPAIGGSGYYQNVTGYLSNFRILRNTLLYTGSYSVSGTPLTVISNTILLTCHINRFIDSSSNAFALTMTGTVLVQAFSPFSPSIAYGTTTVGGSAYFDGTGDYLTWPGASVTTAFTFECWFYYTGTFASTAAFVGPGVAVNSSLNLYINNSTQLMIDQYGVNATSFTVPTMLANTWYHVAFVRNSSNSATVFLNGTRSSTGAVTISTNFVTIGAIGYVSSVVPRLWIGYLSSIRYWNAAIYDPTQTTITIPTAPTSPIDSTLCLNFTNGGIYDATGKNNLETVNNAIITNAQAKFNVGALYFDGTDDYLTMPTNPNLDFGTGDFTIELWVYFSALTSSRLLLDRWASGNTNSWQLYWRSAGTSMTFLVGASTVLLQDPNASRITTGTWYHIAVTRLGTTNRMFIDGTVVATATDSTSLSSTLPLGVGIQASTSTNDFNGYMTDIRITKGIARYSTSNFTAPGTAFLGR
jgi:hypothetical protein